MPDIAELHNLLYSAMQLEHATIPPYLTALYSLNSGANLEAVQILRVVAVEEMLHLTLAANVMNAVGGKVDLTVPGFVPSYPAYLPDGEDDFTVDRQAFSKDALQMFLKIERASVAPDGQPRLVANSRPDDPSALGKHPDKPECRFYSIGDFYKYIEITMVKLEREANDQGKTIFVGDPHWQIGPEYCYSGGGEITAVTDIISALKALNLIIEQGEGLSHGILDCEGELSHYFRFQQLDLGQFYVPGDSAGNPTGPKFELDYDAVYPVKTNVVLADMPHGSGIQKLAQDFNQNYWAFLKALTEAFGGRPELLLDAVPTMFRFRNQINELVRNPIPGTGSNAGPTFEV